MTDSLDKPAYGPKQPFPAKASIIRPLGGPVADKDSVHIEVELGPDGPAYVCGDSLGVYARNDPADVAELLSLLSLSGDEPVTLPRGEGETSLGQALAEKLYFLARPGPGFIRTVM
ncbi:MAG: hypothetical protein WC360_08630, partial [Opitutales bacterium]